MTSRTQTFQFWVGITWLGHKSPMHTAIACIRQPRPDKLTVPIRRLRRRAAVPTDLRDPFVHRVGPRLDTFEAAVVQVPDAVGDPIRVLLDRDRHVAKTDGLPRPVIVNRFGKPATCKPR